MAKCRSICMGVLITAFLLVLFPKIASAEENLLLVCQNEAEGEQLLKLIAAAIRQGIEPVLEWEYEAGMAADYRHVITTSARPCAGCAGRGREDIDDWRSVYPHRCIYACAHGGHERDPALERVYGPLAL